MNKQLPSIYKSFYEIQTYLYVLVRHFPKDYKYTLGNDILKKGWEILDGILEANNVCNEEKKEKIEGISVGFDKLKNRLRFSRDMKIISNKRYGHLIEITGEFGKMLSGWQNWSEKHSRV